MVRDYPERFNFARLNKVFTSFAFELSHDPFPPIESFFSDKPVEVVDVAHWQYGFTHDGLVWYARTERVLGWHTAGYDVLELRLPNNGFLCPKSEVVPNFAPLSDTRANWDDRIVIDRSVVDAMFPALTQYCCDRFHTGSVSFNVQYNFRKCWVSVLARVGPKVFVTKFVNKQPAHQFDCVALRQFATPLLLLIACVVAYPAKPGPYDIPLPDGSTLRVWATGDEFSGPRYVDAEGRHVLLNRDGTPSYYDATGAPGVPLRSRRHAEEQAKYSPLSMPSDWDAQARHRRALFDEALAATASKRAHARATEPLVFVLVQYPDYASRPGIKEQCELFVSLFSPTWVTVHCSIQSVVFEAPTTAGDTINSYYAVQSKNKFQFTRAKETSGTADDGVIGPVTVDCSWVNQSGWGGTPDYSCIQTEGLLAAAPFLDLKSYDLDGDNWINGTELHIVLLIAGGDVGTLSAEGIQRCPHVWGFMQPGTWFKVQSQGVTFGEHVVVGENDGDCTVPFKIGVLTHELAHTLTVPDLYDSVGGLSILGPWCLMDSGMWNNNGRNPGMMSAFGWATPTVVSSLSTAAITIQPASVDPDNILQFGPNPNGMDWEWGLHSGVGEYFLVENRQHLGVDTYTNGSGVLVWHVNEAAAPDSNTLSALSLIVRPQRKNQRIQATGNGADDVLTLSTRASMYCDSNRTPNTLLDNDSLSCVSLSATVNTATHNAVIEPWTDTRCGACVYGSGGIPISTTQYSIFEQFGFSLVPMVNASAVAFSNGAASVPLPWPFTFAGTAFKTAIVSQYGFINFISLNAGSDGRGKYPSIAAFSNVLASSVSTGSFTCAAPFEAAECFAVQWTNGTMTTQAVLAASGNIYLVYSGDRKQFSSSTFISTGIGSAVTYPGGTQQTWVWTDPAATPVALLATPRAVGLLNLPVADAFESAQPSSRIWSHVTCGAIGTTCGSASGKALTFTPTVNLSRNAMTYGINVTDCARVNVSVVLGPAVAFGSCSPVTGGAFFAVFGTAARPWTWIDVGNGTQLVDIPEGTTALNLAWNVIDEGMFFLDDLSVTSHSSATDPRESSADQIELPSGSPALCASATLAALLAALL
eukprot:m51a1_g9033 hypothetical protein (1096) ;mRNA; f:231086-235317